MKICPGQYWAIAAGTTRFSEDELRLENFPVENQKPSVITLDQFLKQIGIVGSGGQAKLMIQAGEVLLNGVVETRRGKKLAPGDVISVDGEQFQVPQPTDNAG